MTADPETSNTAPSLRNLQILEVLASEARPMTPTEINASLGLPKPTIHRLIGNLEQLGYLTRHLDGRSYLPGPKVRQMMLGVMRAGHHNLPRREILSRLNERIGETCNLSIPDCDAMVYVDRVETHWPLRIALQIGSRVPLHATAAGKVYLGSMPEQTFERYLKGAKLKTYTSRTITDPAPLRDEITRVRSNGYAQDSEEFVNGMIAMAVPVAGGDGNFAATLSFHAPKQRLTLDAAMVHLPVLREAASELSGLF